MSTLFLFSLLPACGTLVIDVKPDDDSGATPDPTDTGAATDTGDDVDSGDSETSTELSGKWKPGLETTPISGGVNEEYLMGLFLRDMNDDGNLDLVLGRWLPAEETENFRAEIWLGDGSGGFASPNVTTGRMSRASPAGPNLADVNGDGALDMLTGDDAGFGVFLGNGRGDFAAQLTFDLGWMYGQHAGAADLNGDGADDIVVSGGTMDGYPTLAVYSYDGGSPSLLQDFGYLGEVGRYFFGAQVLSARLDDTGLPAALWVDSQRTADQEIAFHRDRDTSTSSILPYYVAARLSDDGIRAAAVADLNGDGLDEIVSNGEDGMQVYDPATDIASVLHTDGDWSRPAAGIAIGDLNGDGDADALEYGVGQIVGSTAFGRFAVSLSRGGTLRTATEYDLGFDTAVGLASSVQINDLNGDGCGDVVAVSGFSAVTVVVGDCAE